MRHNYCLSLFWQHDSVTLQCKKPDFHTAPPHRATETKVWLNDTSMIWLRVSSGSMDTWPDYLQLNVRSNKRELRSNSTISLEIPRESGTFQDNTARIFNSLPDIIRNCLN